MNNEEQLVVSSQYELDEYEKFKHQIVFVGKIEIANGCVEIYHNYMYEYKYYYINNMLVNVVRSKLKKGE